MKKWIIFLLVIFYVTGCSVKEESYVLETSSKDHTKRPYIINGKVYYPKQKIYIGYTQKGIASWYGPNFHGKKTSNGEIYNMYAFTAAHKTLPMNTIVKVTNLRNHKSVIVRINDRGPFVADRIIDLSYAAGKKIGLNITGTAPVKLQVIGFKGKNYVSGYKIQVGVFMREEGAKKTAQKYKKFGYNTEIAKIDGFYKVFIGGFKSYNEAKRFEIEHHIAGFVVGE